MFWAVAEFTSASRTEKDTNQDNISIATRIQDEQPGV
jgi:hypothetical protein